MGCQVVLICFYLWLAMLNDFKKIFVNHLYFLFWKERRIFSYCGWEYKVIHPQRNLWGVLSRNKNRNSIGSSWLMGTYSKHRSSCYRPHVTSVLQSDSFIRLFKYLLVSLTRLFQICLTTVFPSSWFSLLLKETIFVSQTWSITYVKQGNGYFK